MVRDKAAVGTRKRPDVGRALRTGIVWRAVQTALSPCPWDLRSRKPPGIATSSTANRRCTSVSELVRVGAEGAGGLCCVSKDLLEQSRAWRRPRNRSRKTPSQRQWAIGVIYNRQCFLLPHFRAPSAHQANELPRKVPIQRLGQNIFGQFETEQAERALSNCHLCCAILVRRIIPRGDRKEIHA